LKTVGKQISTLAKVVRAASIYRSSGIFFITFRCQVSSGCRLTKIIKISWCFTEIFKQETQLLLTNRATHCANAMTRLT